MLYEREEDQLREWALNPQWDKPERGPRVHDWRTYINDELREMWESFTEKQKMALVKNAQDMADSEEWE